MLEVTKGGWMPGNQANNQQRKHIWLCYTATSRLPLSEMDSQISMATVGTFELHDCCGQYIWFVHIYLQYLQCTLST